MTLRDDVEGARAEILQRARDMGLSIEDYLQQVGNARGATYQLTTLINGAGPVPGRYRTQLDHPVLGTFDSISTEFTLTSTPQTNNLAVVHVVQATGVSTPLSPTDNSNPPAGSFNWNGTRLKVGLAPAAADSLMAFYLTRR